LQLTNLFPENLFYTMYIGY